MRLRQVLLLLAFLLASLVTTAPTAVFAQTETGRVTGVVTDQTGAVVPAATVTLTSTGTGGVRETISDQVGRYVFANVTPGPYTIRVELSGFGPQTANLVVNVGGTVALENRLQVGGTAEAVNVVAESPVINITNAEVSTTVSEDQIRELPTLTRDPYDLVGIAGNVAQSPGDGTDRGTGYNINGTRSSATNIMLDGAANNDEFDATVGQDIPLDSVQEFSVITNNYSAQYGRAAGGIVNVITKSGTNMFTGTAYEFFRSDALSTNTFDNKENGVEKGEFKRHQPGYSFGGPIVRDRAHFFSSLEYIGVRSNDTEISWVPTPQFIATMSPASRAFFDAYGQGVEINGPTLTRSQVSGIVGSGSGAFNSLPANLPVFGQVQKSLPINAGGGDPQDHYQFVSRVDLSQTTNTQAYVRYAYQNQNALPGTNASSPYPGFDTGYDNKNHSILGSVTHVYSPRFTTQTKLVWNRFSQNQPLNGPPQPALYMNPTQPVRLQGNRIAFPGYLPWSPSNAIPFGGPQRFLQIYQDQTWLKGNHDFRFGGTYVHIGDDRTFGAYANSVEFLNTTQTALTSLDNLVTGNIRRFQTAINPQGYPGGTYTTPVQLPSFTSFNRYNEFAFYAADNWSLDRFTVNLGVRYEYYGPQKKSEPKFDSNFYYSNEDASVSTSSTTQILDAVRGGQALPTNQSPIGALWKNDWNNFAPRIGFAWDASGDGRTSLRGGYGMAYERNFGNVTYNVLFNPPQYLVASIEVPTDVPSLAVTTDLAGPFGGIAGVRKTIPGGSLRHVDQNIKTAYTHFYGISWQSALSTRFSTSLEYNGSTGRKLYDLADVNKPGAALVYQGIGTAGSRPNTQYAAFNTRGNRGRSQYHGVTFGADARNIGDQLTLTAKYTFGRAKDNLSNTFSDGGNNFNLGYLDAFDPMLDWGFADYDVRNRLSISAIYELPFLRNSAGLTRTLLGGWQVSGQFTARSGYPFTVYDCTNGVTACMRAIDTGDIDKNVTDGTPTGNPNEFTLLDLSPILGAVGSYVNPLTGNSDFGPYPSNMTERNAFRGPGAWNSNFSLHKRFRVGSRYAAQFRLEIFNLFDHHNLYVHTDAADVSSVTTITGFKGDDPSIGSDLNDANRRIQLGFKFEF
jgi:outer membrane receptor protein involved in Fe transport